MDKRNFLRTAGGASLGLAIGDVKALFAGVADTPAADLAKDETFWAGIRAKYKLKPDYINLENGYYSMQAEPVLEAFVARVREVNKQGSYYMRTTQYDDKLAARKARPAPRGSATATKSFSGYR